MVKEFCSGAVAPEKKEAGRPHQLAERTYKTYTKCDFCNKTLWGVRKQVCLFAYLFLDALPSPRGFDMRVILDFLIHTWSAKLPRLSGQGAMSCLKEI